MITVEWTPHSVLSGEIERPMQKAGVAHEIT